MTKSNNLHPSIFKIFIFLSQPLKLMDIVQPFAYFVNRIVIKGKYGV